MTRNPMYVGLAIVYLELPASLKLVEYYSFSSTFYNPGIRNQTGRKYLQRIWTGI
jgi:hypothetical protein